jgi:hypothetical protein
MAKTRNEEVRIASSTGMHGEVIKNGVFVVHDITCVDKCGIKCDLKRTYNGKRVVIVLE